MGLSSECLPAGCEPLRFRDLLRVEEWLLGCVDVAVTDAISTEHSAFWSVFGLVLALLVFNSLIWASCIWPRLPQGTPCRRRTFGSGRLISSFAMGVR